MLGKRSPAMGLASSLLCHFSCLKHEHSGVLREIYAAPVALTAMVLHVMAGRTNEPERVVAARAKLRLVRILITAFWALHRILGLVT